MDVDEVAAELYGLPPRDFVAARDAKVKQARADDDAAAAREIAALRKPTVVAWLANLLVRERSDQVEPLLELGAALREATESLSGPQLRELSQQRGQVVAALVREARTLAGSAGQTVTEEMARGLTDTLGAALADPAAAEQLRAGRLAEGLTSSGFGGPAVPSRPPAKTARPPSAAATTKKQKAAATPAERRAAERRERTEAELAEAWSAARAAADARDDAEDDLIRAGDAARAAADEVRATTAEVERLRGELEQAEQAQADGRMAATAATTSESEARKTLRAAEKEADRSRRRVADLQRRLGDD